MSTLRLRLQRTQGMPHQHLSLWTSLRLPSYVAPAPVRGTPTPAVEYVTLRSTVHAAPAHAVVVYIAPATSYVTLASAAGYITPKPAVDDEPAPVGEYISPATRCVRHLDLSVSTSHLRHVCTQHQLITLRLRLWCTLHLGLLLSSSRLHQSGTQHQHLL